MLNSSIIFTDSLGADLPCQKENETQNEADNPLFDLMATQGMSQNLGELVLIIILIKIKSLYGN